MRFSIVLVTLADVLPVVIVVAVQSIHYKSVCPYPSNLFIDVLAKVGYIKNATSIGVGISTLKVEVCIAPVRSDTAGVFLVPDHLVEVFVFFNNHEHMLKTWDPKGCSGCGRKCLRGSRHRNYRLGAFQCMKET
jgi:hypothetical protein